MRKALLLLGILNDSDLDWMIAAGTKREVASGSVVIQQGRPIDEMFLVLDGVLSVRTDKTDLGSRTLLFDGLSHLAVILK